MYRFRTLSLVTLMLAIALLFTIRAVDTWQKGSTPAVFANTATYPGPYPEPNNPCAPAQTPYPYPIVITKPAQRATLTTAAVQPARTTPHSYPYPGPTVTPSPTPTPTPAPTPPICHVYVPYVVR